MSENLWRKPVVNVFDDETLKGAEPMDEADSIERNPMPLLGPGRAFFSVQGDREGREHSQVAHPFCLGRILPDPRREGDAQVQRQEDGGETRRSHRQAYGPRCDVVADRRPGGEAADTGYGGVAPAHALLQGHDVLPRLQQDHNERAGMGSHHPAGVIDQVRGPLEPI